VAVSLSEPFEVGALLREAEERGLEGVVSKRCVGPYRSGERRDWRKVKTLACREASRERWRLFRACLAGASGEHSPPWETQRTERDMPKVGAIRVHAGSNASPIAFTVSGQTTHLVISAV